MTYILHLILCRHNMHVVLMFIRTTICMHGWHKPRFWPIRFRSYSTRIIRGLCRSWMYGAQNDVMDRRQAGRSDVRTATARGIWRSLEGGKQLINHSMTNADRPQCLSSTSHLLCIRRTVTKEVYAIACACAWRKAEVCATDKWSLRAGRQAAFEAERQINRQIDKHRSRQTVQ